MRVLIVDDSAVSRLLFRRMLAHDPGIEVVGEAQNGKEALSAVPRCSPDLVLMDIAMPVMDGLLATGELMRCYPRPVVLISDVHCDDASMSFRALAAGALDILGKPAADQVDDAPARARLCRRLRVLAEVPVVRRRARPTAATEAAGKPPPLAAPIAGGSYRLLCVGASTGGPPALVQLLLSIGRPPWPVLIVQHMTAGFLGGMVSWLADCTALPVEVAQMGVLPRPGRVYLAPDDVHLTIASGGLLALSAAPPMDGHRPAVNALFASAARAVSAPQTIAVLLTGMGRDGAQGMRALCDAGAYTIAQDEATSAVFGMPRVARDLGGVREVLPLEAIGPRCLALGGAPHLLGLSS